MSTFQSSVAGIWSWICLNPTETLFLIWMVLNLLYAQLPIPTNSYLATLRNQLGMFLQFVVTHRSEPGTFKWPSVVEALLKWTIPKEKEPDTKPDLPKRQSKDGES